MSVVLGSRSPPALVPARGSTSVWAALLGSRLPVVSRGPPPGLPPHSPLSSSGSSCDYPSATSAANGHEEGQGSEEGASGGDLGPEQPARFWGIALLRCGCPPAPGMGGISKMGPYSPASGKGAARDLFSLLLHSPTTLCRTLQCYGRKRKPDVWPSWPGRGERLQRHCQWAGEAPAHHPGSPHTPPKCFTCVNMLLWPQI